VRPVRSDAKDGMPKYRRRWKAGVGQVASGLGRWTLECFSSTLPGSLYSSVVEAGRVGG